MRYSLKEVFAAEEAVRYLVGISFEMYDYDSEKNLNVLKKGWELPYSEADMSEIDAYASGYGIESHEIGRGASKTWVNENPHKDEMTGAETYYVLHVKNLDGSDISEEETSEVNDMLGEEREQEGMTTVPRPLTM